MLRKTASAMTVLGKESISYEELSLRLEMTGDVLQKKAAIAETENKLTSLMISFFFKGGRRELGCEFLHKSFREYLFAESIVETLKEYGHRTSKKLTERDKFWKDFETDDPRYHFGRNLSKLIAPQWISPESLSYLLELIPWEIQREKRADSKKTIGNPTEPINIETWENIRDGLADLWDWWAEGVHLRPQPVHDRRQQICFEQIFAHELVEWSQPMDVKPAADLPATARTVTIDSHIGNTLFQICSLVHFRVAVEKSWIAPLEKNKKATIKDIWKGLNKIGMGPRRCQSIIRKAKSSWIVFAPFGGNSSYFANYVSRINAAGGRPMGPFPLGFDISGTDLRNVTVSIPIPRSEPLNAIWNNANLSGATLSGSCFYQHKCSNVLASYIYSWNVLWEGASLIGSNLTGAKLSRAILARANLRRAILASTDLREADLTGANLTDADLRGSNINDAKMEGAKTKGAKFK